MNHRHESHVDFQSFALKTWQIVLFFDKRHTYTQKKPMLKKNTANNSVLGACWIFTFNVQITVICEDMQLRRTMYVGEMSSAMVGNWKHGVE